ERAGVATDVELGADPRESACRATDGDRHAGRAKGAGVQEGVVLDRARVERRRRRCRSGRRGGPHAAGAVARHLARSVGPITMRRALLCLLLGSLGCNSKTAVHLAITLPEEGADQLAVSGTIDGDKAFEPGVVPSTPRSLGTSESFNLFLPATLGGRTVLL